MEFSKHHKNQICQKVISLLPLYIDGKLDNEKDKFVKRHLDMCPECYRRCIAIRELISQIRLAYKEFKNDTISEKEKSTFCINEYENFLTNLSSYFDNELSLNDSVSMKKYMIKYQNARQKLEDMNKLHIAICESANSVKKSFNKDFSSAICEKIYGKNPGFMSEILIKIASVTCIILLLGLFLSSNWSIAKTVREKSKKLFKKPVYVQRQIDKELATDLMQNN